MSLIPFDDRDGSIWFDGEIVPWRDAKTHSLSHGLHYASWYSKANVYIQAMSLKALNIQLDYDPLLKFLTLTFRCLMTR